MDLFDPQIWFSFFTLSILEIVLGIDNVIFISILVSRLPESQQDQARRLGLGGALLTRILLIFCITWIAGLTKPFLTIGTFELSWRGIILFAGGLFLLAKGTFEIHHMIEGEEEESHTPVKTSFWGVILQIMVLDIVFSLDSVITAVGMTSEIYIMIAAVVVAILIMLAASGPVSRCITNHPTTKMLALSFLLLVGVALVADGFHFHIPRGYLYFAIMFSIFVEALNLAASKRRKRKRAQVA
jgi:predicted tellurium resistance membrane protein TerC